MDVALAGLPAECEELSRLRARAVDSLSGALTLRREAGPGKTMLLDETAGVATDGSRPAGRGQRLMGLARC